MLTISGVRAFSEEVEKMLGIKRPKAESSTTHLTIFPMESDDLKDQRGLTMLRLWFHDVNLEVSANTGEAET